MIKPIPLGAPEIGEAEIEAVTGVLRSGRLSLGEERPAFERELAQWVGAGYAHAVSSGTAALHLVVRACGIGHGDEVITTPFSFISSTNCFLYEGASPVFVDIDPDSLTIDETRIESAISEKTRAILATDIFGYPAEWQPLADLAQHHGLQLIEDAAQALGAEYRGNKLGSHGHPTIFSFYPNKQITTAEGGAVVTNDEQLYHQLKSLSNQGRGPDMQELQPEMLGYNYRMSELSAALGRTQLRRLDQFLARRREAASWYEKRLRDVDGITLLKADDETHTRSWFAYVVQLTRHLDRDGVINQLAQAGIAAKAYLPSIHLAPHVQAFGYKAGDFPVSEAVSESALALPFYTSIKKETVDRVCETLTLILSGLHSKTGVANRSLPQIPLRGQSPG